MANDARRANLLLPGKRVIETIEFTQEMLVVLAILALTIYLFVSEVVRIDVAAIIVMVLLGLGEIVPAAHLFDGFGSNAVISIIAVMIMGAGLDRTGIMTQVANFILRIGGSTERRIVPMISGTVGVISSFMQNAGAAALFLPMVSRISTRTGIPLSRLLMPMGYCTILGGTMTMIGSSPLIVLNDLIITSNRSLPGHIEPMEPFGLFAVTPIGVVLMAAGVAYFTLAGRLILPVIKSGAPDPAVTARYFRELYGIEGSIFEARVPVESPLVGQTVGELERFRETPLILGLRNNEEILLEPPIDTVIWAGSVFALMGDEEQIQHFRDNMKLELKSDLNSFIDVLNPARSGVAEVVIPPGSILAGNTIRGTLMRKRYRINVLAVYRGDRVIRKDELIDFEMHVGDTLVVHSKWDDLAVVARDRNFVVVTDFPRELVRPNKVIPAVTFFVAAISLALFSGLQLSLSLLIGALGMILSNVLTVDEAYRAIGWQTVFLLACLLPLGMAVESTGTAAWIAQETLLVFGDVPAWVLQAVVAGLTTMFTLVITNVGATVLLVPLAVNIAVGVGADPAMFALTVGLAASNSFLIPTHQVNALIMGPAGYRVIDFMRAGSIMTVLFLVLLLLMLNLVF